MADDSMSGSLSVSLNAGITTARSTVLGSDSRESGFGVVGDLIERYFFSESWVTMGAGVHITSRAYACE